MDPNGLHDPDLSPGSTQVKMSILHTSWIAIIIAVKVYGPQRMKSIGLANHAALATKSF